MFANILIGAVASMLTIVLATSDDPAATIVLPILMVFMALMTLSINQPRGQRGTRRRF